MNKMPLTLINKSMEGQAGELLRGLLVLLLLCRLLRKCLAVGGLEGCLLGARITTRLLEWQWLKQQKCLINMMPTATFNKEVNKTLFPLPHPWQ